jgi:hypothetical protein
MWLSICSVVAISACVSYLGILLFRHRKLEDSGKTSTLRILGLVLATIGGLIFSFLILVLLSTFSFHD